MYTKQFTRKRQDSNKRLDSLNIQLLKIELIEQRISSFSRIILFMLILSLISYSSFAQKSIQRTIGTSIKSNYTKNLEARSYFYLNGGKITTNKTFDATKPINITIFSSADKIIKEWDDEMLTTQFEFKTLPADRYTIQIQQECIDCEENITSELIEFTIY